MSNRVIKSCVAVATLGMFGIAGSAEAAVIFNDTFDSGTGAWYKADTTNPTTLSNASGQLSFENNATATNMTDAIGRAFAEQTLAVGETLRLKFDYRQSGNTGGLLRVGLYDLTGRSATIDDWSGATSPAGTFDGYYGFVRDASASGNILRQELNIAFNGGVNNIGPLMGATGSSAISATDFTNFNIDNTGGVTYSVLLEISRSAAAQVDVAMKFSSGITDHFSLTGSDTTSPFTKFDAVVIRPNDSTIFLDNVELSVVPEPMSLSLLGLGGLMVGRRPRA